jgi:hypothetical protein
MSYVGSYLPTKAFSFSSSSVKEQIPLTPIQERVLSNEAVASTVGSSIEDSIGFAAGGSIHAVGSSTDGSPGYGAVVKQSLLNSDVAPASARSAVAGANSDPKLSPSPSKSEEGVNSDAQLSPSLSLSPTKTSDFHTPMSPGVKPIAQLEESDGSDGEEESDEQALLMASSIRSAENQMEESDEQTFLTAANVRSAESEIGLEGGDDGLEASDEEIAVGTTRLRSSQSGESGSSGEHPTTTTDSGLQKSYFNPRNTSPADVSPTLNSDFHTPMSPTSKPLLGGVSLQESGGSGGSSGGSGSGELERKGGANSPKSEVGPTEFQPDQNKDSSTLSTTPVKSVDDNQPDKNDDFQASASSDGSKLLQGSPETETNAATTFNNPTGAHDVAGSADAPAESSPTRSSDFRTPVSSPGGIQKPQWSPEPRTRDLSGDAYAELSPTKSSDFKTPLGCPEGKFVTASVGGSVSDSVEKHISSPSLSDRKPALGGSDSIELAHADSPSDKNLPAGDKLHKLDVEFVENSDIPDSHSEHLVENDEANIADAKQGENDEVNNSNVKQGEISEGFNGESQRKPSSDGFNNQPNDGSHSSSHCDNKDASQHDNMDVSHHDDADASHDRSKDNEISCNCDTKLIPVGAVTCSCEGRRNHGDIVSKKMMDANAMQLPAAEQHADHLSPLFNQNFSGQSSTMPMPSDQHSSNLLMPSDQHSSDFSSPFQLPVSSDQHSSSQFPSSDESSSKQSLPFDQPPSNLRSSSASPQLKSFSPASVLPEGMETGDAMSETKRNLAELGDHEETAVEGNGDLEITGDEGSTRKVTGVEEDKSHKMGMSEVDLDFDAGLIELCLDSLPATVKEQRKMAADDDDEEEERNTDRGEAKSSANIGDAAALTEGDEEGLTEICLDSLPANVGVGEALFERNNLDVSPLIGVAGVLGVGGIGEGEFEGGEEEEIEKEKGGASPKKKMLSPLSVVKGLIGAVGRKDGGEEEEASSLEVRKGKEEERAKDEPPSKKKKQLSPLAAVKGFIGSVGRKEEGEEKEGKDNEKKGDGGSSPQKKSQLSPLQAVKGFIGSVRRKESKGKEKREEKLEGGNSTSPSSSFEDLGVINDWDGKQDFVGESESAGASFFGENDNARVSSSSENESDSPVTAGTSVMTAKSDDTMAAASAECDDVYKEVSATSGAMFANDDVMVASSSVDGPSFFDGDVPTELRSKGTTFGRASRDGLSLNLQRTTSSMSRSASQPVLYKVRIWYSLGGDDDDDEEEEEEEGEDDDDEEEEGGGGGSGGDDDDDDEEEE